MPTEEELTTEQVQDEQAGFTEFPVEQEEPKQFGISEEKLEEIRENVKREIDRADQYYESEIEPDVIKRHKVYESDKKYYKDKFPRHM